MSEQNDPIIRGKQAAGLAENPLLVQAFDWLQQDAMRAFQAAKGPEEAWRAKQKLDVVTEFVAILRVWVHEGKTAAEQLARDNETLRRTSEHAVEEEAYRERARIARDEADQARYGATQGENNG